MKETKTIPVYNRKSQKVTSLAEHEFNAIGEVDENFFNLQGEFVIIKDKFFRSIHLVKDWTFCVHGTKIYEHRLPDVEYKKVLFILESPHKHEFDYVNGFRALKPLIGSFLVFQNGFHKLMEQLDGEEGVAYEVTLYNPVPFQTSLHYLLRRGINERTRFNFWLYGWWDLKYHKEFENFIKKNPFDFYINASTKSFNPMISHKLSTLVKTEYQVYHPSSGFWSRKEVNFGIKKVIHLDDSHFLHHLPDESSIF